jgi:NCAIR mutase (PurE)-related protein
MNTKNTGFENLGFARVDIDRARRRGFPEVIYAERKTPAEVAAIAASLVANGQVLLATRASHAHFEAVQKELPDAIYHERGRCITLRSAAAPRLPGRAGVLCAGTSDLPVAEEAAITLETFGADVVRVTDAGVAGIHRLLSEGELLATCNVLVVAAGMEGALPSVVAGFTDCPIIAVPTSVGYGASFEGLAALLGMMTSCGSGVTVVNIDNGFGAGYAAAQILRELERHRPS